MEIHLLRTGGAVFVSDGLEVGRYETQSIMACHVGCMLDELAELTDLRATIAKLDKTADGVPVVPGLDYWFYSPGLNRIVRSLVHETDAYDKCYSTKEAAEAAREQEHKNGRK